MALSQHKNSDLGKPPVIDSVRRNLIEKVRQLRRSIEHKDDTAQINKIISELKYHAVFYFTQKEKLMLINHNTSYHQHRQEHDHFIWNISDLQSEIDSNHHSQAIAICADLGKWLNKHRTASGQENYSSHFSETKSDPTISF